MEIGNKFASVSGASACILRMRIWEFVRVTKRDSQQQLYAFLNSDYRKFLRIDFHNCEICDCEIVRGLQQQPSISSAKFGWAVEKFAVPNPKFAVPNPKFAVRNPEFFFCEVL